MSTADAVKSRKRVSRRVQTLRERRRHLSARSLKRALQGGLAEASVVMATADAAVGQKLKEYLQSQGFVREGRGAEQRGQDSLERDRQALAERRVLVDRGEVLDSPTICDLLGMTRQSLSRAVGTGRLFSLEVGTELYYPRFFVDPDISRKQLEKVCKALGDLSSWTKYYFFTQPRLSLGEQTPLEELRHARIDAVLEAAVGLVGR